MLKYKPLRTFNALFYCTSKNRIFSWIKNWRTSILYLISSANSHITNFFMKMKLVKVLLIYNRNSSCKITCIYAINFQNWNEFAPNENHRIYQFWVQNIQFTELTDLFLHSNSLCRSLKWASKRVSIQSRWIILA